MAAPACWSTASGRAASRRRRWGTTTGSAASPPSDDLRKWFGHDPDKWGEFRNRYLHELSQAPEATRQCLDWCSKGPVTLLFSASDRDHNQAVVLRDYLAQRLKGGGA
nr:DUF488 family protein [Mesobaculum littorinae]